MTKRNSIFVIFGFLFFLNFLAWFAVYNLSQPQFLEIVFFDVGQGDAIFIETPKRHQILIDGGPDSTILEKLGKEMPFWDRTIDLIILSHPERDHLAGLLEVLKSYKVENILWTGVKRDTGEYEEWLKLIREEGAKIFIAKSGQRITMPPGSLVMEVLYPLENFEGKILQNSNDTSIVARLIFGENQNSFLFTGDATKVVEQELIENYPKLDSDVLKIGHHGSKTSSSENFIKEVSPEIAVISVGRNNSYGHPHQEVLETLEKYGIRTLDAEHPRTLNASHLKVLRTDLEGDINLFSDGKNLKIKNQE